MTMPDTAAEEALAPIQHVWSGGDYDRLASYGSAPEAARLTRFAAVDAGDRVLDVGTGSGIVAIVAAQRGARAIGLDPTPALLAKAADNAALARVDVGWRTGVAEMLPFPDGSFDVVLSQYAHMFSNDPARAASEMLRVLRPSGRMAFAAWTPDGLGARLMGLAMAYMPVPPAPPPPSPFLWGSPAGVARYLGSAVGDLLFEHHALMFPALSPGHVRRIMEETFGPTVSLVRALAADPERLSKWRREYDAIATDFFRDGYVRFEYLMTRATKPA